MDNLQYDRLEGFRTTPIAQPFRLCEDFCMNDSRMVPGAGLELAPSINHLAMAFRINFARILRVFGQGRHNHNMSNNETVSMGETTLPPYPF